jgi:hypothetical protein
MKKIYKSIGIAILTGIINFSFAQNIYITENTSGNDNGIDCTNAHSISWLNNPANWGTGAGQVKPGTTVHLCGTFTGAAGSTMLDIQGSGSAGNPITFLFEPNAIFTAPYWSGNGAIVCSYKNYITIDGGPNGQIIATANGTNLVNQQQSQGINATECNNLEILNITVADIYVRTPYTNDAIGGVCIAIWGGSDVFVHHNTVHDAEFGIYFAFPTGVSNNQIYENTIFHTSTGIVYGSQSTASTASDVLIHHNEIYDEYFWDSPADVFHCDGVHVWGYGPAIAGMKVYGNYIHGNNGGHITGWLFFEGNVTNLLIYNNVLQADPGTGPTDGFVYIKGPNNTEIYNNAVIANNNGQAFTSLYSGGLILKNNITYNVSIPVMSEDNVSAWADVNYNNWYNASNFVYNNYQFHSYADWQALGYDANSITTDPLLDASYHLQAGSPAAGSGLNFYNLYTDDKDGNLRPAAGPWDMGAYQTITTGVNEGSIMNNDFTIYPSLTSDKVTIQVSRINPNTSVEVMDAAGKILFHESIKNASWSVDINSYKSGIYLLRVVNGESVSVHKVIKM